MKKYTFTLTALVAVLGLAVMPSCKKDDDNSKSRTEMMVGSWKLNQDGDDLNNNKVWDSNERENIDSGSNATFTFTSGGSGSAVDASFPIPISFTWSLMNSDNDLRIIYTFPGLGSDTLSTKIVSLTDSELITRDDTDSLSYFMSLKKQ